jgi:uncharacterized protein YbbC (DUF1343 family)
MPELFKMTLVVILFCLFQSCLGSGEQPNNPELENAIFTGAEQTGLYLPLLGDKRVAIVANQTSIVYKTHLVDTLLSLDVQVVKVFGPEHGFRGTAADGEKVESGIDPKTGIKIVSLYGNHRKPTPYDLENVEVVVFDIQDVGARFYTYISTMSYVMEACAENGVKMIVLDRPNPHGDYVDGPVLDPAYSSFVGLHPIPVVHGMTVGEYALMVNGESWLKDGIQCDLKVVPCENYNHNTHYELPIAPSPNLPNNIAIQLYPSLCFFEGTIISVGRGTDLPFQVIGHPEFSLGSFNFTPEHKPGIANHPKYEGQKCYGQYLKGFAEEVLPDSRRLHLDWLIGYYEFFKEKGDFFTAYFDKLAGTDQLRKQLESGLTEEKIRESWSDDLDSFKQIRKKYLLYPDFE